eukprot:1160136-Pelagomonas_calceolata.AAC.16
MWNQRARTASSSCAGSEGISREGMHELLIAPVGNQRAQSATVKLLCTITGNELGHRSCASGRRPAKGAGVDPETERTFTWGRGGGEPERASFTWGIGGSRFREGLVCNGYRRGQNQRGPPARWQGGYRRLSGSC